VRIAIGADHAGFALKEHFKATLARLRTHRRRSRHAQRRIGRLSADLRRGRRAVASEARRSRHRARRQRSGRADRRQQGDGVRAALCNDLYTARLSREHNDANVLSMGGASSPSAGGRDLTLWLDTPFEGGRHQRRVDQIASERRNAAKR
jgi:ribose 5-phosphate isomerase B